MAQVDFHSHLVHKIVCTVILEREGRFLMLELANEGREYQAEGKWTNPGGRLHKGETFQDALTRSLAEKLNTEARITGLVGIYQNMEAHADYDVLRFVFRGELTGAEPTPGARVKDIDWMEFDDVAFMEKEDKALNPHVAESVRDYLAGKNYPLEIMHSFITAA